MFVGGGRINSCTLEEFLCRQHPHPAGNSKSLLVRLVRFARHGGWTWLLFLVALVAILAWRLPSRSSQAALLCVLFVSFTLPFFVRYWLIKHYSRLRRCVGAIFYVALFAFVVARIVGHQQVISLVVVAFVATSLGGLFWASSDPMFEMVAWLAFPTEYGRTPDEIHLYDTRSNTWPNADVKIKSHLFRFRYDDDWAFGIVGPITFAFGDQKFEGKSPEEIYATYGAWFESEGIGKMVDDSLERED